MDFFNEQEYDGAAVITCYATQKIAANALVFTDDTTHLDATYRSRPFEADYAVLNVCSSFDDAITMNKWRFIGVSLTDSTPQAKGYVSVQISGCVNVRLHSEDTSDKRKPLICMDMLSVATKPDNTLKYEELVAGKAPMAHIEKVDHLDPLRHKKTVGLLLAHGRAPSTLAKLLLLPGLHAFPAPATHTGILPASTPSAPAPAFSGGAASGPVNATALTLAQILSVCSSASTSAAEIKIQKGASELLTEITMHSRTNPAFMAKIKAILS